MIEIMQIKKFEIFTSIQNLTKIFFETLSNSLNIHNQIEHAINLIDNQISRIRSYYNMSQDKLSTIREYLFTTLKKKWICSFNSLLEVSMLFVKKLNDNLRLCVNYRELNEMIMKNKYSLFLLSEILDRFTSARYFIKIDIRNAYHRIRIRKNDEWKTAFRTRYEQFKYQMMFFDLVNTSAIFQFYVNEALKSYIDIYCMMYLNDVLIYSNSKEQH